MKRCVRCDGDTQLAKGRTTNGVWQVFRYCFPCQKRQTLDAIAHRNVPNLEALPVAWDHMTDEGRKRRQARCATCFRLTDVEFHHWAPKHIFGCEAEYWPGAELCRPCHLRWHRMVTPTMSVPTAVRDILASLPPEHPVAIALARAEEERLRAKSRQVSAEMRDEWDARRLEARLEAGEITRAQYDETLLWWTKLKPRKVS